jgi:hypothetical protein
MIRYHGYSIAIKRTKWRKANGVFEYSEGYYVLANPPIGPYGTPREAMDKIDELNNAALQSFLSIHEKAHDLKRG